MSQTLRLFRVASMACLVAMVWARGDFIARVAAQHAANKPLTPLTNQVVNAPDTTEHDTQSNTAVIRGSGSTVIAAFVNTALDDGSHAHVIGRSRSTNGGTTWTDQAALPSSAGGDIAFPMLARDQTSGQVYLSTAGNGSVVQMFRSIDDGATWLTPVNAMPGFTGGDALVHPWVAVDNFPGTGQGTVFVVARNLAGGGGGSKATGVYLSSSIDGGTTFVPSPAGNLSTLGAGPTVVVGTDHAVYVFWWVNLGGQAQIRFVKSIDHGTSFGPITTAALLNNPNGDMGVSFYTNSFPQVAVHPVNGALVLIYNDKTGGDRSDIYITASFDGGAGWDTPEPINNDRWFGGTRDQFMPTLVFTPDGRHLLFTWYDRRSDPSNTLIERWGAIVTITLTGNQITDAVLTPSFRISTASWPVVIGQDSYVAAGYMGFYDTAAADNDFFYVTWGDNRSANPANIPQTPLPHANQPDVRFARISVSGPPDYDLDRDWQTDRTVFRPSNGTWYSALSGGGATATVWGVSTDIDVMGDYDGDGKADLAVWRPSTGYWYVVQSSNGQVRAEQWGQSGDIPLVGDVNDDFRGLDDFTVYRNGSWYTRSLGGGTRFLGWGSATDLPLLADFDGDGRADPAVFRPSNGFWYVYTSGESVIVFGWGQAGDVPVAADYDGDRMADIAVFRPSTGQWFVHKSSDGGSIVVNWGAPGDIPVSGDWDGDSRSDYTVWRPSDGGWYTQYATGGVASTTWGTTGDKPVGRRPGS